ncbi:hypothetical protein TVNIR_0312 [Thioalkalivibrio nitratireducens DSM 14787]|uniref:Uncharacterized protein n=1 Tax=Thioalkalivibrio nitratireducens (strain DSM 14787 / UNIQEM 213 / ALEN2) TaxID=1255043 RepID=L0DR17_THIND|nr:hypothetical protein TVNIR_0312 [Thioalkalivibrio nitratireducens DSM 14787]
MCPFAWSVSGRRGPDCRLEQELLPPGPAAGGTVPQSGHGAQPAGSCPRARRVR